MPLLSGFVPLSYHSGKKNTMFPPNAAYLECVRVSALLKLPHKKTEKSYIL